MRYLISVSILATLLSVVALSTVKADQTASGDEHHMSPVTGSQELEKMKTLSGSWQGTSVMDGEDMPVSVTYKTTSNGSAVVETVFPGTPHEMISVYYDVDGKLTMTHYCALNNQPEFTLKKSAGNRIDLDFAGGTNLNAGEDGHMHSVSIGFEGSDKIVQEWTYYEEGKEKKVSTFTFTRADQ